MKKKDIAIAAAGGVAAAVAIKMIMRRPTVDWKTASRHVPHSEHSNFVAVDGARVHYQEFGGRNAPTIINSAFHLLPLWKILPSPFAFLLFRFAMVPLLNRTLHGQG